MIYIEESLKTLASTTNELKVGDWSHLKERNKNGLSIYVTPLNTSVMFILHRWNQSNVEKPFRFQNIDNKASQLYIFSATWSMVKL